MYNITRMHEIVGRARANMCMCMHSQSFVFHSVIHLWLSSECDWEQCNLRPQNTVSQASWSSLEGTLHMVYLHATHLSSTPCAPQNSSHGIDRWKRFSCCSVVWQLSSLLLLKRQVDESSLSLLCLWFVSCCDCTWCHSRAPLNWPPGPPQLHTVQPNKQTNITNKRTFDPATTLGGARSCLPQLSTVVPEV